MEPPAALHSVLVAPRPLPTPGVTVAPATTVPDPLSLEAVGTQPRLLAAIVAGPEKSDDDPVRSQPALEPRRSVTVAWLRLPFAEPPTVPPLSRTWFPLTTSVNSPGEMSARMVCSLGRPPPVEVIW